MRVCTSEIRSLWNLVVSPQSAMPAKKHRRFLSEPGNRRPESRRMGSEVIRPGYFGIPRHSRSRRLVPGRFQPTPPFFLCGLYELCEKLFSAIGAPELVTGHGDRRHQFLAGLQVRSCCRTKVGVLHQTAVPAVDRIWLSWYIFWGRRSSRPVFCEKN